MVGRSHECDYPADVLELPVATRPRFAVDASSRDIDRQVKALAAEVRNLQALGVYEVLPGVLRELQPTHIVTQTQCDVCAVSERDVLEAVRRTADCNAAIVSLQPNTLADISLDFVRVGEAVGLPDAGRQLASEVADRISAIRRQTAGMRSRPTVAALEWIDPLMAAGNWLPELIRAAGGSCVFGEAGAHAPWISFAELAAADPDAIVLLPCGFGIERALRDVPLLEARPGWRSLRAVRTGRVFVADGNRYFNRPGPGVVESTEILAEMLHPETFRFGHRGAGWIPIPRRS